MNVLERHEYGLPDKALNTFHQSLNIADWHADNFLWDRDFLKESAHGHVDLPRLIKGNFAVQVFGVVTKSPKNQNYQSNTGETDNITLLAIANRWPIKTWSSLLQRALYQSERMHAAQKRSNDQFMVIKNRDDLQNLLSLRQERKDIVGGILSIEGLHAMEGDFSNVGILYDAGFRILGFTHFFDNEVGGSSAGIEQGGLTELGKRVVDEMDKRNMIIDLAHASPELVDDILRRSKKPVIVSHTGVKSIVDSPRNLTDDQIREIAKKGGVIGIGFWDGAVGSTTPASIVRSIRYVVELVGIDHVSLGSDWDGSTTTYFDAANIWVLTKALREGGFSDSDIKKIMGQNTIDFLLKHLPQE